MRLTTMCDVAISPEAIVYERYQEALTQPLAGKYNDYAVPNSGIFWVSLTFFELLLCIKLLYDTGSAEVLIPITLCVCPRTLEQWRHLWFRYYTVPLDLLGPLWWVSDPDNCGVFPPAGWKHERQVRQRAVPQVPALGDALVPRSRPVPHLLRRPRHVPPPPALPTVHGSQGHQRCGSLRLGAPE